MSKNLSLDQTRALKAKARSVGAWPSNRQSNVLHVPQPTAIQPARPGAPRLSAPQQQAIQRSVGQEIMPPMPSGCCVFPGSMKYIAQTVSLLAGGTATLKLESPGMFCPMKMFIFAADLEDVTVSSIKAGIRNQILAGSIVASAFGIENECCPIACLDCLCMPGVSLDVTVTSADEQDVTVVLIGCYVDACPPGGMQVQAPVLPSVPGCPTPGGDKLVGFDSVEDVGIGESFTFEIETAGRFCPRQMLLFMGNFDGVFVTGIKSGIEDQIISGMLPAELWSIDNNCCILSCFKCLCAPGVPLFVTVLNGANAQRIRGMLVGTYTDAC